MFALNENQSGLTEADGKLISVLHSINEPKIAAADRPAEATQAYICTLEQKDKSLLSHIILYLTNSGLRVMYSWDQGGFALANKEQVEDEALDFVENMGFMMDSLGIGDESSGKDADLSELPVYANGGASASDQSKEDIGDLPDMEVSEDEVLDVDALLEEEDLPEAVPVEEEFPGDSVSPTQDVPVSEETLMSLNALAVDEVVPNADASSGDDFFGSSEVSEAAELTGPSMAEMEAEFSRGDVAEGEEEADLGSLVSTFEAQPAQASAGAMPQDPVAGSQDNAPGGKIRQLVRLLASL